MIQIFSLFLRHTLKVSFFLDSGCLAMTTTLTITKTDEIEMPTMAPTSPAAIASCKTTSKIPRTLERIPAKDKTFKISVTRSFKTKRDIMN